MFKQTEILSVSFLLIVLLAASTFAADLTPEGAVVLALSNNRELTAARLAIRQAENRLQQAGLLPNPEVEVNQRNETSFDGEYAFSTGFKQRFPITSRLTLAKEVARVDVATALAEVRNRERMLAGAVLTRSREWLVIRDKIKANQEIQNTIQKLVGVSEKRLQVAEASAADVNTAKLELQRLKLAQAALANQQETVAIDLNRLLGRESKTPLQLAGAVGGDVDLQAIAEMSPQAPARRPDRQLAALTIDRAGAEVELARAEKWEDWTLGVDYSHSVDKFDEPIGTKTSNFVGIGLSIPLPLWNKSQGKIGEAEATRQRAEAEFAALDQPTATETQTAENQLRRLDGILRQYRNESLKLAEENIALLQKGYREGLVNITTVIQAQQQYSELRLNYLETLAEFQRSLTDWQIATAYVPYNLAEQQ